MARTSIPPTESPSIKRLSLMVGFHRSAAQLQAALEGAGVALCERTMRTLPYVTTHGRPAMCTLGFVTPYLLGLEGEHELRAIVTTARSFGLTPCLPEVGPILRLAYEGQPEGEWVIVPHRNFCDDAGMVSFALGNIRGQRWLRTEAGGADIGFRSEQLFAFVEKTVPPLDVVR